MPGRPVYLLLQDNDVNVNIIIAIHDDDMVVARNKAECDNLRE